MLVESCENRWARLRLEFDHTHLRPGVTVSGSTMMLLADTTTFASILTTMGSVVLAVTTNLNINVLCILESHRDLLGESLPMKVGKRLILVEVIIYSQDYPEPGADVTCANSIPLQSKRTKVQS